MHYDYRKDFIAQVLDRLCTCIACIQRWTAKLIVDVSIQYLIINLMVNCQLSYSL